jgi:hypothetical protein
MTVAGGNGMMEERLGKVYGTDVKKEGRDQLVEKELRMERHQ